MTIELCVVSGTVVAPDGSPMPNVTVQFRPAPLTVRARGASAVAPSPVTVVSGADAGLSVALAPGVYTVRAREDRGREYQPFLVDVPAKPEADLSSILFDLPPPQSVYDAAASAHTAVQAAESVLAARIEARQFPGRASLVTAVQAGAELPEGVIVTADGIAWRAVSGATAIPDLPGLVPVEPAQPEHWGAVGDGITDDRTQLTAALAWGGHVVAGGRYGVRGTVAPALSRDLQLDLLGTIVALDDFPAGQKLLAFAEPSEKVGVIIRGGVIDGRAMPELLPGTAPNLLTIHWPGYRQIRLQGTHYLCNDDSSGTAGDSCVSIAAATDVVIEGNVFQGAVDAGVYMSGDQSGTLGSRVVCIGNTFLHCQDVGFISKRNFRNHIVMGNFLEDCGSGIVIGGAAETNLGPLDFDVGKFGIISGNELTRCRRPIEARISDRMSLTGNVISDFGGQTAETGILLSGSSFCVVQGNTIAGPASSHPGLVAIRLMQRSMNGEMFDCQRNLITANSISNVPTAVREESGADHNVVEPQMVSGVGTAVSLAGASSMFGASASGMPGYFIGAPGAPSLEVVSSDNFQSRVRIAGGVGVATSITTEGASADVSLSLIPKGAGVCLFGGALNGESLRVNNGTPGGTALQVMGGNATEQPVQMLTRGSGADIDMWLRPKGAGRVRFGSFTSSADVPVAGFITIRDNGGVLRKLAVIE